MKYLELMIKNKKRSMFIQTCTFDYYIYRVEPDDFIELVPANGKAKLNPYKKTEEEIQL